MTIAVMSPWHWQLLPLHQRSGTQIFRQIGLDQHGESEGESNIADHGDRHHPAAMIAVLLESPARPRESSENPTISPLARYSICAGPPRWQDGYPRLWTPPLGTILPTLRRTWTAARPLESALPAAHLPFTGGWLGWFGYDLAQEIERLPRLRPDPLPFPPAFWYEPQWFVVLDHDAQDLWLAATTPTQLKTLEQRLHSSKPEPDPATPIAIPKESLTTAISWQQTQAQYEAAVEQVQQHIQAGDIFQANLSLRFAVAIAQDGWSVYQRLQQINPSPFASYWRTPWGEVVSCSPERLVQVRDRQVQTRPIAGTRPRGDTPEQDLAYAQALLHNRKENAEHIMLVDLERNDLGRVCEWGTVQVDELLTIERYSHVMHLVSNVTGTLHRDRDWLDVIQAVFPGGTITGCPKVRCMEIIAALEPVSRSLFYGSCGYLDQRGHLDLNILIRTLLVTPWLPAAIAAEPHSSPTHQAWGQVGAGIVADSDPHQEWHESRQKAQAQLLALEVR